MKEVKIAKDCVADGVKLKAGDMAELSEKTAAKLKARGFLAKPSSSKKEKADS